VNHIPILKNHDHQSEPIGFVVVELGRLIVHFPKPFKVTREALHAIFGNIGFKVLEHTTEGHILRAEICEWSLPPVAAAADVL
jgi:hypothetical protein